MGTEDSQSLLITTFLASMMLIKFQSIEIRNKANMLTSNIKSMSIIRKRLYGRSIQYLEIKFRFMSGHATNQCANQDASPKRTLFSYLCPCFNFNSTHTIKPSDKHSMNHTEESVSTLPFDHNKPKDSLTEAHPDLNHDKLDKLPPVFENGKQSGIYITFKQNESDKEQPSEYAQMQEEYDRYLRQQNKPKPRYFPINALKENQIIVVGNQQGRMLCRIKSIFIEPSASAYKKQVEAQKSKEKSTDPVIEKFWDKRYFLFEKFDQGIKLDQQSWFSVTPEAVAEHIASRLSGCERVLDGFCGAGGDSIKLAINCKRVVSNDIDPRKIQLLRNNAAVYAVDNIETISQDFFDLQFKRNQFEAVYMSPPWGGPEYHKLQRMMPEDFIPPLCQIINKSLALSDNVILLLPKNTDIESIPALIGKAFEKEKIMSACSILLEKIFFEGSFKFIILYIGSRVARISLSDELQYIYRLLGDGHGPFRYKRVIKKVREELGLFRLLNLIFECEKGRKIETTYEKLLAYLIENDIITQQKISKMQQQDENDAAKLPQGKKEKKMDKQLIKSMKYHHHPNQIHNLTGTCNEAKGRESTSSPAKQEKLDQTVSYVSSMTDSKMTNSITFNENIINQPLDKSGVKIEQLLHSNIPRK